MDWFAPIDNYCERLGPGYWAEPINALTNLCFLLAAFLVWRRIRGTGPYLAYGMVALLALIGLGSFLFHTHAQVWSGFADVGFIGLFILLYLFAAARDFLGRNLWWSLIITAGFFPYSMYTIPRLGDVPLIGSSAPYLSVALLIAIFGWLLRQRAPETARGLWAGSGLLVLSILLRSLDGPLCNLIPFGTHFAWHMINSVILAHMILVYRRHMLARPRPGR